MHLIEVDRPAVPDRFHYCDLNEAFMARPPYGDSMIVGRRAKGDLRRNWFVASSRRGRRYRISASGHTSSADLGGLSVLDNQVAVSRSCQRGSVWWRSKPQFCGGETLYYQHRPAALWALPHLPVFE